MKLLVGTLGTGTLLFLCYALYVLWKDPYEFLRLNHASSKANVVYRYAMLFVPPIFLCVGMYHVVFFLLGWMPENWGSYDEDGYVTLQSSLSTTIGVIAGAFLSELIGRGISARVHLSAKKLRTYLNKRVQAEKIPKKLEELRENLETAKQGEDLFAEDYDIYNAIRESGLPIEALREIFFDTIQMIELKQDKQEKG